VVVNIKFLPASAVLETDAPCLISQDLLNIIAIVELIVKAWGDIDLAGGITILNHNNVIGLEESTPVMVQKSERNEKWVLELIVEMEIVQKNCSEYSIRIRLLQLR
jgi:hypothetical protein